MRNALKIICCGLLTAAALAAAPPVALSTVGNVWTNQVALPSGSQAAAGDVIETDDAGLAILASGELGRVEVRSSTRATLASDALELERGSAASERLPIRLGEIEAAPATAGAPAWFVVSGDGGRARVAAHEGDVVIRRAGREEVVVPAGHYAMALPPTPQDSPPSSDEAASNDDDEDEDAAAAGDRRGRARQAGSSGGGFTIGPLGPTASIALVGAGTAAGLTGFALAAQDDETPVSPE